VRAGTSIEETRLRASRVAMASGRVGMKGVAIRKRLAGRWVKTIVCTRPIRAARRGAASWEKAEKRPDQKKIVPVVATERSNRWKSQSARSDWTTNPPPSESRLKSAASR
jgi:hypothetical protein